MEPLNWGLKAQETPHQETGSGKVALGHPKQILSVSLSICLSFCLSVCWSLTLSVSKSVHTYPQIHKTLSNSLDFSNLNTSTRNYMSHTGGGFQCFS